MKDQVQREVTDSVDTTLHDRIQVIICNLHCLIIPRFSYCLFLNAFFKNLIKLHLSISIMCCVDQFIPLSSKEKPSFRE